MNLRILPSVVLLNCLALALSAEEAEAKSPDAAPAADVRPVFGPYQAIVYDRDYLQGVRVEDNGDVFLMFKPHNRDAQVVIRISMQEGAGYRKWFTGEEELMAQENSGRAPDTWTDRVQTTAHYIEYRDGQRLFLHLKKIKS